MGLPPFQRFLDAHRDEVYRFLVASVGRHDAEDCFQETFLAALRGYPRLTSSDNLRGWIFTIANRKAIDVHRARARQARGEVPDGPAAPDRIDGEPALWAQVRALPDKQRAAVVHRYVNDLRYAEIAEVLGCSADAARRNVHEGLKKLREVWT